MCVDDNLSDGWWEGEGEGFKVVAGREGGREGGGKGWVGDVA